MCDNRSLRRINLGFYSLPQTPSSYSSSLASSHFVPNRVSGSGFASLEHPGSQTGSDSETSEPWSWIRFASSSPNAVPTSVSSKSISVEDGARVLKQLNSLVESEHLMVASGMMLRLNEQNLPDIAPSVSHGCLSQIFGLISSTEIISTHWKNILRSFPDPRHPDPDAVAPITHFLLQEILEEADMLTKQDLRDLMEINEHFSYDCVMDTESLAHLFKVPQLVCQLWGIQLDDEVDNYEYWSDDLATQIYDQNFGCYTQLDRIHREMKMCQKDMYRNGSATFHAAIQHLVQSAELEPQLGLADSDLFNSLSERVTQVEQGDREFSPSV